MPLLWPSDSMQRPFEVFTSASGVGLFAGILDTFPGLDNAGHAAINRGSAERLFARFATETTAMGVPGIDSQERFAIKKNKRRGATLLSRMSLSSPDRARSS